ncbi:hypothetical protein EXN66_Car021027 [Channa argus]|uniref:Uncharacterized protein n=1 Tax=Channa argus TaxID=215402 RepID=A0A6G1QTD2_CHAAH|nr:hypothetical protein EXN66_Car021027 [Channa argus]
MYCVVLVGGGIWSEGQLSHISGLDVCSLQGNNGKLPYLPQRGGRYSEALTVWDEAPMDTIINPPVLKQQQSGKDQHRPPIVPQSWTDTRRNLLNDLWSGSSSATTTIESGHHL